MDVIDYEKIKILVDLLRAIIEIANTIALIILARKTMSKEKD